MHKADLQMRLLTGAIRACYSAVASRSEQLTPREAACDGETRDEDATRLMRLVMKMLVMTRLVIEDARDDETCNDEARDDEACDDEGVMRLRWVALREMSNAHYDSSNA